MASGISLEDLITVQDAAKIIGRDEKDVYNLVYYHRAFRTEKIGSARMVHKGDVEEYAAKKAQTA